MDDDLKRRLTDIFATVMGEPALQLDEDQEIAELDDWDSLKHVALMTAIETECQIRFSEEEFTDLTTVGALIVLVRAKAKLP